jgi:hypothetical protein
VVDRACPELDRERDRALLGELVAVQAEREPGCAARLEVAARLPLVERAALQENVRRLGDAHSLGQHVAQDEVEIGVAVSVELGRHRVRAEPRRGTARVADRPQRGKLRLAVEPVARLALERRRAVPAHPAAVPLDRGPQAGFARLARRSDGREDAAAARVQLLVARAARSERELLDAVAPEGGMRVAVDEARDRAEPAAVDLDDIPVEGPQIAHPPHRVDRVAREEDERVLEDVDLGKRSAAQRCVASRGCRELCEIADEQPRAHASRGTAGILTPPRSAASTASA